MCRVLLGRGYLSLLPTTILFEIGEFAVVGSVYSTLYNYPLFLFIIEYPNPQMAHFPLWGQVSKKFNRLARHVL